MKILYIIESAGGGSAKHLIDLSSQLLKRGHEIHIIYSPLRMDNTFADFLKKNKSKNLKSFSLNIKRSPNIGDVYFVYKIRKYIKQNGKFDIVHSHSSKGGALARLACFGLKTHVIYTPHTLYTNNPKIKYLKYHFFKFIELFLDKITRKGSIIATCEDEKKHMEGLGISKNKIKLIHNGINPKSKYSKRRIREKLRVSKDETLFGIVGRFDYAKGIDIFIKSVGLYTKKYKSDNVKFTVLGYGEDERVLKELAQQEGVQDKIIWVKDIDDSLNGFDLMHGLDVYVLTSNYEGMPYVLIEALCTGLPIISTNVSSVKDIVDNEKNGYIVNVGDLKAIAEKINILTGDGKLRNKMGELSKKKSKRFSLKKMVDKTEELYRCFYKQNLKEIVFVHEGKAIYPELTAYKEYFKSRYKVREILYLDLKKDENYSKSVLWYLMGFYPKKVKAGFIIHDYRSLSVGKFGFIKDKVKKFLNHKPDLRIFLNEKIRDVVGFNDRIKSLILDMGVPKEILKYKESKNHKFEYDFCYIGSISRDRGIDKLLQNFVKRYGESKTFLLLGRLEDKDLLDGFKQNNNIIYKGLVSQEQAFKFVQRSEFAVCYLPNKKPFCYQTPTKLLEYIALGKKIIINNCLSNLDLVGKLGINYYTMDGFHFPQWKELKHLKNNKNFDLREILWSSIIKNSGIENYL